ncbi:MAG: hypothetical protein LUC98_06340 [Lachnospiraceae bacterium]|nr:hypothetical protein [Lachnospiraceae bacterium]
MGDTVLKRYGSFLVRLAAQVSNLHFKSIEFDGFKGPAGLNNRVQFETVKSESPLFQQANQNLHVAYLEGVCYDNYTMR